MHIMLLYARPYPKRMRLTSIYPADCCPPKMLFEGLSTTRASEKRLLQSLFAVAMRHSPELAPSQVNVRVVVGARKPRPRARPSPHIALTQIVLVRLQDPMCARIGSLAFTDFAAASACSSVAFRTGIPYTALLDMPSQLLINVGIHQLLTAAFDDTDSPAFGLFTLVLTMSKSESEVDQQCHTTCNGSLHQEATMRCRSHGVMSSRRFNPTIHAPRRSDACRHPGPPCATTRISGSGDWTRNKISGSMLPALG